MDEEIDLQTLFNCTSLVLSRDVIAGLNRTEILTAMGNVVAKDSHARLTLQECLLLDPQSPSYVIAWWQKVFWIVLFSSMVIVATTGNAIVMWIVLAHRRMRTVTNYFLVNLSFSDLLMSLFNCIFNFTFMLDSHWPFGAIYCTVNNFVAYVSVAASVFTLVAISLDRYMAIVRPLKHRMSRRKARIALVVIWLASCLLALPCLLYSTTMSRRYSNGQIKTVCYLRWPDGHYPKSMTEHVYNLVFLVVTYLGPVIAMAICYTLMGRELWGSKSIGEQTQRQLENIKSKRKVVRMFITVITIFTICWLPYHGYFIYVYHNKSVAVSSYVPHIYLFFYWLAMSNAMVNPIIYYWMNNRFRVYFKQIICVCCVREATNPDLQSITNQRQLRSELLLRSKSCHLRRSSSVVVESMGVCPVNRQASKLRRSGSAFIHNQKDKKLNLNNSWTPDMTNSVL